MAAQKTKRVDTKNILKLLIIFFTVILPILFLLFGVWLFYKTNIIREVPEEEMAELEPDVLRPSQVLENKYKYKGQKLTIWGKISQAPMVCERKECPKEDSCCGCKPERNIVISDPEAVVVKETVWRLRVLGPSGQAFCKRLPNSCQYECPDWEMGSIYELKGIFFAEPPPRGTGWRIYFDFYFEVEEKKLIRKPGIIDIPKRFFKGIQELIQGLGSSGYYILD